MSATVTRGLTIRERIDVMTVKDPNGCWTWRGHINDGGYASGTFRHPDGTWGTRAVHRVTIEEWFGPIAPGLVVDHECRNTLCVRPGPGHCVPVTQKENCARSRRRHFHGTKLLCKNGHSLLDEATVRVDERGYRTCRLCHSERARAARAAAAQLRRELATA